MKSYFKFIFTQVLILITFNTVNARSEIPVPTVCNDNSSIVFMNESHSFVSEHNSFFTITATDFQTSGNSADFESPTAWVGGIVPPAGSNITIAHNITLTQHYTANNIVVESNIVFNTDTNVNLLCQSVTLNPDATFIMGAGSVLKVIGNITNNGLMYFRSDGPNGSAQFDEFNGVISGSGEVTTERFIPAKRIYRFHSSTVNTSGTINDNWQEGAVSRTDNPNPGFGTHITGSTTGANGFDQTSTGNPSIFTFDNTYLPPIGSDAQADAYASETNTDLNTLGAGQPKLIFIRGDRSIDLTNNSSTPTNTTLRSTGDLHTGSLTFNVGNPTDYLNLNPDFDLYSLVANPYQAIVDYRKVSRDDITNYIYVWDVDLGGANARGGYVTVQTPTDLSTIIAPKPGLSDINQFLAPGMPFFVENLDNSSSAITTPFSPRITFQEDDKATDEQQINVYDTYPNFYINSRIYKTASLQSGNRESDALGLRFSEDYTTIGSEEDGTKLFNNRISFAVVNNGLRSIDKRKIPVIGDEIELFTFFNLPDATNYSFTYDIGNQSVVSVFLEDNYLGTQTEISNGFVYDFSIDTSIPDSIAEDRFKLLFDNFIGVEDNTFGSDFSLYPNPSNGQFSIKTPNLSGEVNIEITSLLGQLVYTKNHSVENNQISISSLNLEGGVYVVKMSQDSQVYTTKVIME